MFGIHAQFIVSDAAGNDAFITEQTRHISKIRGRAPKLATVRENIPEKFSEPHRRELFHGQSAFLQQEGAFARNSNAPSRT